MKVQAEHEGHARLRTIILKTISGMKCTAVAHVKQNNTFTNQIWDESY